MCLASVIICVRFSNISFLQVLDQQNEFFLFFPRIQQNLKYLCFLIFFCKCICPILDCPISCNGINIICKYFTFSYISCKCFTTTRPRECKFPILGFPISCANFNLLAGPCTGETLQLQFTFPAIHHHWDDKTDKIQLLVLDFKSLKWQNWQNSAFSFRF